MINYIAYKKRIRAGLEFSAAMIDAFSENLTQNYKTQDNFNLNNQKIIVNQRGEIAFSTKDNELVSMIEEKTGYKLRTR